MPASQAPQQAEAGAASGGRQPVRRRLALPGLPPREQRTAAAALAAGHTHKTQPNAAAANEAAAPQHCSTGTAVAGFKRPGASAAPARASMQERGTAGAGTVRTAAGTSGAAAGASGEAAAAAAAAVEVAAVEAAVAGSRDTGLWAELAAELRGSRILQPAPLQPGELYHQIYSETVLIVMGPFCSTHDRAGGRAAGLLHPAAGAPAARCICVTQNLLSYIAHWITESTEVHLMPRPTPPCAI